MFFHKTFPYMLYSRNKVWHVEYDFYVFYCCTMAKLSKKHIKSIAYDPNAYYINVFTIEIKYYTLKKAMVYILHRYYSFQRQCKYFLQTYTDYTLNIKYCVCKFDCLNCRYCKHDLRQRFKHILKILCIFMFLENISDSKSRKHSQSSIDDTFCKYELYTFWKFYTYNVSKSGTIQI